MTTNDRIPKPDDKMVAIAGPVGTIMTVNSVTPTGEDDYQFRATTDNFGTTYVFRRSHIGNLIDYSDAIEFPIRRRAPLKLKFKRLSAGHYMAARSGTEVEIRRVKSIGMRSKESLWCVYRNGESMPACQDILREAKDYAERWVEFPDHA